jgi:hypothetical protein
LQGVLLTNEPIQIPFPQRLRLAFADSDIDLAARASELRRKAANLAKGVTINGLVILTKTLTSWNPNHTNPPGGLANYYRNNVIGGPGAFVMVVENSSSFGDIIVQKLIAEIAQAVPQQRADK